MAKADLKSLLRKMNAYGNSALENAAGLCVGRSHYEVTVDHVMLKLVEAAQSMQDALKGVQMDVTHGRNYQTVPFGDLVRAQDANNVGTLLLHAQALSLAHPQTHEPMTFESPCPF